MIKKLFVGTFGVALNVIIYILVILLAIRVITWSYDFAYEVFGDRPLLKLLRRLYLFRSVMAPVQMKLRPFLIRKGLLSINMHLLYMLDCLSIKAC